MDYMALKHTHLLFAALSIVLFYVRAFARIKNLGFAKNKVLFISSHSVDTLLLVSAVALAITLGLKPSQQPWLLEKIILVIGFIGCGIVLARQSALKAQLSLLALATTILLAIGYLARFKTAFLL